MQARIKNPAFLIPEALPLLQGLGKMTLAQTVVPKKIVELVHLRVSQINGCSVCVDMSKKSEEPVERLLAVSAWRDSPLFSDSERAALALAESITRIADSSDPVPDAIWKNATDHFDEAALAALVLCISVTNVWNRLNVATRQVAGGTW